jgi:hypothetical protein
LADLSDHFAHVNGERLGKHIGQNVSTMIAADLDAKLVELLALLQSNISDSESDESEALKALIAATEAQLSATQVHIYCNMVAMAVVINAAIFLVTWRKLHNSMFFYCKGDSVRIGVAIHS